MKRNPQGTVIIDLDNTLIATRAKIKPALFAAVHALGISPARARAVYTHVRTSLFSPARYARALFLRDPRAARAAARAIERAILAKPRAYTYPGVEGFLTRLGRRHRLVLMTWGDLRWHRQKIAHSGLAPFFDEIIITPDPAKRAVLRRLAAESLCALVDDDPLACATARALGVPAIQVRKSAKDAAYYRKLEARIERALR